ncbi:ribonuclease III [Atopobiaceae bacterium 24-176]
MVEVSPKKVAQAEKILNHKFSDRRLVETALCHPSAAEGGPVSDSYERLEFLGDSILGAIVALDLFSRFPGMDEGELSRLKVTLVSGDTLSQVACELGVGDCIVFGASEENTQLRGMHSALENVYESLVGALYLDAGFEGARRFVLDTLGPHVDSHKAARPVSPKSRLQELTQRDLHCGPEYKVVGEAGPAHAPTYTAVAIVQGVRVGRGCGPTKKAAEAEAAHQAILRLTQGTGEGQVHSSVLATDIDGQS